MSGTKPLFYFAGLKSGAKRCEKVSGTVSHQEKNQLTTLKSAKVGGLIQSIDICSRKEYIWGRIALRHQEEKMAGPRFVAVLFFTLFSVSLAFAQSNPNSKEYYDERTNLGLGLEFKFLGVNATLGDNFKISNVPLELRQVPSHPDDTWIYGSKRVIRTIPDDSIKFSNISGLTFSLSPELTVWRFRLRSGPNFYHFGSPGGGPRKSNEGSTREINQYGKPTRGYGTSLVYYSIYGKNSWKPGMANEADLDIGKNLLLMAGYGWNNYKLVTESGYDRWDMLERYEMRELADNRLVKRYLGFGWQPDVDDGRRSWRPITVYLLLGKTETLAKLTEFGRGMTIEYGRPWFLEFGFSAHGVFLKK